MSKLVDLNMQYSLLILEIKNVLSYMFDNCWDTTDVNFDIHVHVLIPLLALLGHCD